MYIGHKNSNFCYRESQTESGLQNELKKKKNKIVYSLLSDCIIAVKGKCAQKEKIVWKLSQVPLQRPIF